MSDNLTSPYSGFRTFSTPQVLRLSGADAVAFAQAQFSSDVAALADGHWQWSTWLSAKGRVLAVFQLLRLDPQQLLLVCHDGDIETMAGQLRGFVFRRKVTLTVDAALPVSGAFSTPERAAGAQIVLRDDGTLELDVGTPALPRCLRIGPATVVATAAEELAWRQSDLRLGLPRLIAGQHEQWTPQQLGLDRLNAYSVKKGCYPGQEIVARTHFLGKAKRSALLLRAPGPLAAGQGVSHNGSDIGTLASTAGEYALAVLPLDLDQEGLRINGERVVIEPVVDGLAR